MGGLLSGLLGGHGCGSDDSLLFFFLLLMIIFCNCNMFGDGSELLFFFLILVVLFCNNGCGGGLLSTESCDE